VLVFGWNSSGQLGIRPTEVFKPKTVKHVPTISAIYAGECYAMLLDVDGNVWAAGCNSYGQLGNGLSTHHVTFGLVQGVTPLLDVKFQFEKLNLPFTVSEVSCGSLHTLFVDGSGGVWGTGWNARGQLGFISEEQFLCTPIQITSVPNSFSVAAGWVHSLFLTDSGHVWGCGNGLQGKLGIPCNNDTPVAPVDISLENNLPSIRQICVGKKQSFCLDFEGNVYATGANSYGELGLGDNSTHQRFNKINNLPCIESIAFGSSHLVLVDADGAIWGCGLNSRSAIGFDVFQSKVPLKVYIAEPIGCRVVQSRNKSARK